MKPQDTSSAGSINLEQLLARVAGLEAESDIARTIQNYALAIDDGLDAEWVDCYTEDGVFEVRTNDGLAIRVRGHAQLSAFITGHTKAPVRWHKHVTTSHRIELKGNTATAGSYIIRIDNDDDEVPKIWVFGRYIDELIRSVDGKWRFSRRTISLEGIHPTQRALMRQRTP